MPFFLFKRPRPFKVIVHPKLNNSVVSIIITSTSNHTTKVIFTCLSFFWLYKCTHMKKCVWFNIIALVCMDERASVMFSPRFPSVCVCVCVYLGHLVSFVSADQDWGGKGWSISRVKGQVRSVGKRGSLCTYFREFKRDIETKCSFCGSSIYVYLTIYRYVPFFCPFSFFLCNIYCVVKHVMCSSDVILKLHLYMLFAGNKGVFKSSQRLLVLCVFSDQLFLRTRWVKESLASQEEICVRLQRFCWKNKHTVCVSQENQKRRAFTGICSRFQNRVIIQRNNV